MRPFEIAKKTKVYISLALVLLCTPVMATAADLSQTTRLANQGNADAQNKLGVSYDLGEGVEKDEKKEKVSNEPFGSCRGPNILLGMDSICRAAARRSP